jgi:flagellar motility protein MotE (MotC chaperone)
MKLLPKSLFEIKVDMKIFNILIFVAAFIFVTGGLLFLNSIYSNIFKFDFSPISARDSVSTAASTISPNDATVELNKQLDKKAEAIEAKDSTETEAAKDTVVSPPKITAAPQVIPAKNKLPPDTKSKKTENKAAPIADLQQAEKPDIEINSSTNQADVDTIYQKWIKQTAKLYESMDAKKAAMIIKNYSESTARDIIYKMKKRKAAEVLAELDPVTANKIARFPGDQDKTASINN